MGGPVTEAQALADLKAVASRNKVFRSYIGMGYYGTNVPGVIGRNMLENPGWYTAYTPYQAEISQGRLDMLLNFQQTVMDLTRWPSANTRGGRPRARATSSSWRMTFTPRPST